ncbi:MAG: DUF5990 family protein [Jatrophihabitans sp.]
MQMRITVRATHLLARRSSSKHPNLHIGLQVRQDAEGLVPADASSGEWTAEVLVIEQDGSRDFRGPAVHGKRGERFLYLSYGDVIDGSYTMSGRAKIMLEDAPEADAVTVTVVVSDDNGRLRTARLRPPVAGWSVD